MLFMFGIGIFIFLLIGKWIDKFGIRFFFVILLIFMFISVVFFLVVFIYIFVIGKGIILLLVGISYGVGNVVL